MRDKLGKLTWKHFRRQNTAYSIACRGNSADGTTPFDKMFVSCTLSFSRVEMFGGSVANTLDPTLHVTSTTIRWRHTRAAQMLNGP